MAPKARQSASVSRRASPPPPPPPLPARPATAASPAATTANEAYVPPTPMAEMVARLAKKGRWRTARPAWRMMGGSRKTKKVDVWKVMSRSAVAGGRRRSARPARRAAPKARPAVAAAMPSPTYRDRAAREWPTDSQRTMARAIMPLNRGVGGREDGGGEKAVREEERWGPGVGWKPRHFSNAHMTLSPRSLTRHEVRVLGRVHVLQRGWGGGHEEGGWGSSSPRERNEK